ncbi:MAG: hypothetical protein JNL79_07825 [Myxococcales bacterium]|nr:hypothetical protein [Myxococcales bacterium]
MNPRTLVLLLGLGAVVVAPTAEAAKPVAKLPHKPEAKPVAKPSCANAVRFTSDALLPLALVRDGKLEADKGQCPEEFFPKGQKWSAIDRFGKMVGLVENTTDSSGMHFRVVSGSPGARVFVRGRKAPYASAAWTPPASEKKKLLTAIGAKVAREVTFFQAGDRKFGVVTERSTFSIAERDAKGQWKRRFHEKNFVGFNVFALRAIVDMDGDGMPEIVKHFSEDAQGHGFEVVLARKPNGDWHEVASNEDTGP